MKFENRKWLMSRIEGYDWLMIHKDYKYLTLKQLRRFLKGKVCKKKEAKPIIEYLENYIMLSKTALEATDKIDQKEKEKEECQQTETS